MLTEREKAHAEIITRDIHPDLFADVPEPERVKVLRKRYNYADQLEDLRRVMLTEGFDLPYTAVSTYFVATEHNYSQEFESRGYIDEKASLAKLRRMSAALRSLGAKIDKSYTNDYFYVYGTFPSGLKITLSVDRGAVCEKKVVGKEWVEPATGYYKEIVEWDCTPVSILKNEG